MIPGAAVFAFVFLSMVHSTLCELTTPETIGIVCISALSGLAMCLFLAVGAVLVFRILRTKSSSSSRIPEQRRPLLNATASHADSQPLLSSSRHESALRDESALDESLGEHAPSFGALSSYGAIGRRQEYQIELDTPKSLDPTPKISHSPQAKSSSAKKSNEVSHCEKHETHSATNSNSSQCHDNEDCNGSQCSNNSNSKSSDNVSKEDHCSKEENCSKDCSGDTKGDCDTEKREPSQSRNEDVHCEKSNGNSTSHHGASRRNRNNVRQTVDTQQDAYLPDHLSPAPTPALNDFLSQHAEDDESTFLLEDAVTSHTTTHQHTMTGHTSDATHQQPSSTDSLQKEHTLCLEYSSFANPSLQTKAATSKSFQQVIRSLRPQKYTAYSHCKFCFHEQHTISPDSDYCVRCGLPLCSYIQMPDDAKFCMACAVMNKTETDRKGRCSIHPVSKSSEKGSIFVLYKSQYGIGSATKMKKRTPASESLEKLLRKDVWLLNQMIRFEFFSLLVNLMDNPYDINVGRETLRQVQLRISHVSEDMDLYLSDYKIDRSNLDSFSTKDKTEFVNKLKDLLRKLESALRKHLAVLRDRGAERVHELCLHHAQEDFAAKAKQIEEENKRKKKRKRSSPSVSVQKRRKDKNHTTEESTPGEAQEKGNGVGVTNSDTLFPAGDSLLYNGAGEALESPATHLEDVKDLSVMDTSSDENGA